MGDIFDVQHDILLIIVVALFILLATGLVPPLPFAAPTPVPII